MTERQQQLFRALVERYVATAQPVSSQEMAEVLGWDISTATIRHECAALEEEGMLVQPHTSAGRIPTEKGYRYYIAHFVNPESRAMRERSRFTREMQGQEAFALRRLAALLAELTGDMAVVSVGPEEGYSMGIGRMFAQPEFADAALVRHLSAKLDQSFTLLWRLERTLGGDVRVFVGSESPFGNGIATVVTACALPHHGRVMLGLIGPARMRYGYNVAVLREAVEAMRAL
jgi:transcriptional regulator of heat shock response